MLNVINNEVFSLRDGETMQVRFERPTEGTWIAVNLRSIEMPLGPKQAKRQDGMPVESCDVLACHIAGVEQTWQLLQLSPPTKEIIGDYLFRCDAPRNVWLYIEFGKVSATSSESTGDQNG